MYKKNIPLVILIMLLLAAGMGCDGSVDAVYYIESETIEEKNVGTDKTLDAETDKTLDDNKLPVETGADNLSPEPLEEQTGGASDDDNISEPDPVQTSPSYSESDEKNDEEIDDKINEEGAGDFDVEIDEEDSGDFDEEWTETTNETENSSASQVSLNPESDEKDGDEFEVINPITVGEREWSILVYMCADNNLEASAIEDLYEMEQSSLDVQKSTVLVLLDRSDSYDTSNGNWSGAKLLKLNTGKSESEQKICSEEIDCESLSIKKGKTVVLDMSSGAVLEAGLKFMKEEFPAPHYGLVMWGHGTGWRNEEGQSEETSCFKGYAYDDSSKTYMTLKQLGKALRRAENGKRLDFLGFDTCFGSELEVLYELNDCADYIAGSEGLLLYSGWNYKKLLNYFQQSSQKSADSLCECTVRQFSEQFSSSPRASVCAVKTEYVSELFTSFDSFMAVAARQITNRSVRDDVMGILYSNVNCDTERYCYGTENSDIYLDLSSAVSNLNYFFESKAVSLASYYSSFTASLSKTVLYSWASDRNEMKGAISENKSGIGIYFSTLGSNGMMLTVHPSSYIKNQTTEQINFVTESTGYVPSTVTGGSLLDKLFYTSFK